LIGTCGVHWYPHNFSALLSYDLNQAYWSQGFMTEAIAGVVPYVFKRGLNRITATTVLENPASSRVLRKLGFKEEGVLRNWAYWKGEFKDLRCFSLLRADFLTQGGSPAFYPSSRAVSGPLEEAATGMLRHPGTV